MSIETTLTPRDTAAALDALVESYRAFSRAFPGESADRQPVHTVYGGAHLFRSDSAGRLGARALRVLAEYAPDAPSLAAAVGMRGGEELARTVYDRVVEKLGREPVEDFRLDFEDGYGVRSDEEEDGTAVSAAEEVAKGMAEGTLPPFLGIRIKQLGGESTARGARTLDVFLTTLAGRTGGRLPENFVVTLPKVVMAEQVGALVDLFDAIEKRTSIDPGILRLELMVETPQSILDASGRSPLPGMVEAARGRCVGAHFGVYDYTASLSITAQYQLMGHPACELARQVMRVALSGTGVFLSDGATNVLPVPVHRALEGSSLGSAEIEENRTGVHGAWRMHYADVRHSLETAFYQGWDLHPAQLASRYAAVYAFFLESLDQSAERLKNFLDQAARVALAGDVFDDAATGQGLLNYFLRGLNCGAITTEEAASAGVSPDELRMRSFTRILEGRARG